MELVELPDWLAECNWQLAALEQRPPDSGAPPGWLGEDTPAELGGEVRNLYEAHAEALSRYARGIVPGAQTACDAVQETFLRYLIARRGGKQIENQKAWLFRVLHNLLLDWRRQMGATAETGIDAAARTRDERLDPEAAFRQRELLRRFESLLSPRELDCLRLRMAGLRHKEMAEVLGVGVGTVGSMLSRIARKSRSLLQPGTTDDPLSA